MSVKYVPLKRRNLKNPQIQAYTEAIRLGLKTYHIMPGRKGWRVKRIGDPQATFFKTKNEALIYVKNRVKSGEVIIHGNDGLIRERQKIE